MQVPSKSSYQALVQSYANENSFEAYSSDNSFYYIFNNNEVEKAKPNNLTKRGYVCFCQCAFAYL